MRILGHTAVNLTIGAILYNYRPSIAGFLWFLIAGIFIDLDHYIDYVRERGISFDFKKVHDFIKDGYKHFEKLTLLLHSYELLILLWILIAIFNLNIIWRYAAMGLTVHIFTDQIANPIVPLGYFLWFRIANNFEAKKLFTKRGVDYGDRRG